MQFRAVVLASLATLSPFFCLALDFDPAKLEGILDKPGLFESPADSFIAESKSRFFKWLSATKKDDAHYPANPLKRPDLLFFGCQVQEANFHFEKDALNDIYVSLYNRGDSGDMDQEAFNRLVASLDDKLGAWSGDKGALLKTSKINSEAKIQAKVWIKEALAVTLKWSTSGNSKKSYRSEYIQVSIAPFDPKDDPRKKASAGDLREGMTLAKDLPKNLKKEASGEVLIPDIPMIDQGAKGYCVDASCARVLRYYGVEVTQHDIAQISASDAKMGTNLKEMIEAIGKVTQRYGVRVQEYYKDDVIKDVRDFERYIKKYNSVASKNGRPSVKMVVRGDYVYPEDTMQLMDIELVKKMRLGDKQGIKDFMKDVKTSVDKGIPLLWAVKLGIVKEKEIPQITGNHMRLIIGYDPKENEIIYSDSWGPGHELKRMSLDDAWLISSFLLALNPSK
jgi:hypothetical protein